MGLTIGTRGSKLAMAQTLLVQEALRQAPESVGADVVRISTAGDRVQDRPLAQIGGKALFVAEIESALREGRIHIAVHSAKDIPSDLPADMHIAACLPRADARDVLITRQASDINSDINSDIAGLPAGSRVGTSSPRRACQLRALRNDLDIRDIRGNVDTRLAKLDAGDFDAIVLAAAGLSRLGLLNRVTQYVPFSMMLPCAGQGAIAIEVLASDENTLRLVSQLDHEPTSRAVAAERAFALTIGGSCETPLAAHAVVGYNELTLSAMIGDASGQCVSGTIAGRSADAERLGEMLAAQLLANGGAALLGSHLRPHIMTPPTAPWPLQTTNPGT